MAIQQERGIKGEQIAAQYLTENGFELVETNFRAGKSEIDLIVKQGDMLIFVEVKLRTSSKFGNPEEFVGDAKAAKVMEGAEAYVFEHNWQGAIRFDIISVLISKDGTKVHHFKDAFY